MCVVKGKRAVPLHVLLARGLVRLLLQTMVRTVRHPCVHAPGRLGSGERGKTSSNGAGELKNELLFVAQRKIEKP